MKEEFIKEILADTLEEKVAKRRQGSKWYEMFLPVKMLIVKMARSAVMKQTLGHYPAPLKAIEVLEETLTMSLAEGLKITIKKYVTAVIYS